MSVLNNSNAIESGGYNIDRSLRFRSSASAYLNRTPASASNRTTWTWSGWVKRGALGANLSLFGSKASANQQTVQCWFTSSNTLQFLGSGTAGAIGFSLVTTQVFRDPSAWYHIIAVLDTTQATAANRVRLYVNGQQITALSTATYCTQNDTYSTNSANPHYVGALQGTGGAFQYTDAYFAEVNFIDGQALTPSSFGQTDATTGVWQPKKYVGTYGTNGFYLPFSDNTSATTLAYDKSGNGNNWTANNISTTAGATYDSMTDVPTLTSATAANYCVLNPLKSTTSLTQANLGFVGTSSSYTDAVYGSIGVIGTSKYYFEVNNPYIVGVNSSDVNVTTNQSTGRLVYHGAAGAIYDASTAIQSGLPTAGLGDVVGVAINLDAGTLAFYKNNVQLGTNVSISSANTWWPFLANVNSYTNNVNFGQRPFSYTPPTGFKALNTFNLPDPTIKKPNQYMDATTYTGNGTSQSIANVGSFQPDLVWVKTRVAVSSNALFDSVRGATKALVSNGTAAENNLSTFGVTAFNSNGFTVVDDAAGDYYSNGGSGGTYSGTPPNYVGWQWKKGATPGFDIVTYAGDGTATRNISHSLGVAPKMIIVKSRSVSGSVWLVGHNDLTWNSALYLNQTVAKQTNAVYWNNTAPTSSVFTLGNWGTDTNGNGSTYVAYLFAEIPGFSKFGSYTGNGSADGPFVYCGFRPKYVMVKVTSSAGYWMVYDSARDTYNVVGNFLKPSAADAEVSAPPLLDFVSNGFKLRGTNGVQNDSGQTYIFAAFAENPFKYSLAR